jgi:hypothetical protein
MNRKQSEVGKKKWKEKVDHEKDGTNFELFKDMEPIWSIAGQTLRASHRVPEPEGEVHRHNFTPKQD